MITLPLPKDNIMFVIKFIFGGICVLGGLVIVICVILASPPVGTLATFSGLSFSLPLFTVIGLFGFFSILIGIRLIRSD
jgi:hypothetical protein